MITINGTAVRLVLMTACCLANLSGQEEAPVIGHLSPIQKYHQDRNQLLGGNTSKLRLSVSLDRQEYLPGEAAQVTITIENGTTDALEVFEPFVGETGTMEVLEKRDGQWQPQNPD